MLLRVESERSSVLRPMIPEVGFKSSRVASLFILDGCCDVCVSG